MRVPGGDVRVGLTHVPGAFLGDAVSVELPPRRTGVEAGEPIGLVESSFTVFELVSPVTGEVLEVNAGAESVPRRVTDDPYGEGWLLTIRPSGPGDFDALLAPEEYGSCAGEGE
jgi:glycine cleavage system H protein